MIADKFDTLFQNGAAAVNSLGFYGHNFGMDRLGYILIPYILRRKIGTLKSKRLKLENGPFPPRKDGGYGWFIVEETVDENENCAEYNAGCNVAGDDSGSKNKMLSHIYYYWISKSTEDAASLIQNNLVVKSNSDYKLNFACFTEEQFDKFISLFDIDDLLAEWIVTIRKNFLKFVPAHLEDQMNQWVSGYLFQIIG